MTKNALQHSLTLKVPYATFEGLLTKKLEEIQKNAKIQGFRPGHAPLDLIKTKYGSSVKGEVLDDLIQEKTTAELKKQDIRPAARPELKLETFEEGKEIVWTISVEALPKIEVKPFDTLAITKLTAKPNDEEINAALDRLANAKRKTQKIEANRATKKGDIVVIDFVGSIDGKEFKGGSGKDYFLDLGSNTFIPGFEDQLIGKKIGDKVDVDVTFPEAYHAKELAGKKALFKVDLKELREVVKPAFDDDFAKEFGMKTMDDMKKAVADELQKEYDKVSRMHQKRALLDALAVQYSFEIPQSMVDGEFQAIWNQFEDAKKKNQLDEDEKKKSEDELKKEYRAIAERRVRLGLLLAEVANLNNITVAREDLSKALMAEAQRYPGQEKMVIEYYQKNPQALDMIKAPLFEEKVVDYILGKAKITEKELSVKELYDFDPDKQEVKKEKK